MAVAKIDCSGVAPEDIRCDVVRPGFTIDVLPTRAREGRFVLLGLRITRQPNTVRGLCLVRLTAGSASALASVTVLP